MTVLRWIAGIVIALAVLYIGAALVLIHLPDPDYFAEHQITEADSRVFREFSGVSFSLDVAHEETTFQARDGETLFARRYPARSDTIIVFLHGLGGDSVVLNKAAGLLRRTTRAEVITPDLRGHGQSGGARYDLDYIGQHEDDAADIIAALKDQNPDHRIILAGHSMGGGIALRYALKPDAPALAGYLLFAPNFGDGPTRRTPQPPANLEAAFIARGFVQFNTKRFIGLGMLNVIGLRMFNHMLVLFMNQPPDMPAYSFAAIATAQPSPPGGTPSALQAIDVPLLVVVGENDELFVAENYEGVVSENSDGETVVLPDLSHSGVLNDRVTYTTVTEWYKAL